MCCQRVDYRTNVNFSSGEQSLVSVIKANKFASRQEFNVAAVTEFSQDLNLRIATLDCFVNKDFTCVKHLICNVRFLAVKCWVRA